MRVRSIIVGVCSAVILLAGGFATQAVSRESSAGSNSMGSAKEAHSRAQFRTRERGNTRTCWATGELSSSTNYVEIPLTGADEIDCSAINYAFSSVGAIPSGFHVGAYFNTSTVYPGSAYMTVPNTFHFVFSPPLRLRAGDTVVFFAKGPSLPAGASVTCEVTLTGFIPNVNRTEGMTVQ